jgi:F-type H+-transporting ATPase subunit b
MDSLIETFHIDLKLLVAQVVNFAIVVSVLYFFALKPLLRTMRERTVKIEKGLKDAEEIEMKLRKTEADYERELDRAKEEAARIMKQASELAEEKRERMIDKAKEEIGQIINEEKEKMRREKDKVLKEMRAEVAGLVGLSLEKVLEAKLDKKADLEMIKRVVKKAG